MNCNKSKGWLGGSGACKHVSIHFLRWHVDPALRAGHQTEAEISRHRHHRPEGQYQGSQRHQDRSPLDRYPQTLPIHKQLMLTVVFRTPKVWWMEASKHLVLYQVALCWTIVACSYIFVCSHLFASSLCASENTSLRNACLVRKGPTPGGPPHVV